MAGQIGIRTALKTSFEDAIRRTTAALKIEGFGVLTQIDIKTTFKDKISVDFRRYVILGACNPALSYRSLAANGDAGLLLPCNVTVQEEDDHIAVTSVNPLEMLGVLEEDATVKAVAIEAKDKLERVISSLNV
jgi:uncharacterized protein (DUF302 family)